jgi:Tfp pilus assembly protein PilV
LAAQARENPSRTLSSRRKGVTYLEVIAATAILIMALLGGSSMYAMGRKQLIIQQRCQAAIHLATAHLEEMRAIGYDGLDLGEQEEEMTLSGQTYERRTYTQLTSEPTADIPKPCKQITVFIGWTHMSQPHLISISTYVGPQ